MIKKIRLLLEYNTYCVWLYDENDEIIDNDNPPEWNDDQELTNAFMTVSDIYDTFFIDNEKEFRYIGCKSKETLCNLENAITRAVEMITIKNNGKYELINNIELPSLEDQKRIQWFVNNAVMKWNILLKVQLVVLNVKIVVEVG